MTQALYDLTTAQSLLLLVQQFTFHKQVNNICTSALIEKQLDLAVLQEAIQLAYKRNDALHIRLTRDGGKLKQYFAQDSAPPDIGTLDFRNRSEEFMEQTLTRMARKRITVFNQPLSKIYLLQAPSGYSGLFLIVSHLILDSAGIIILYKDILKLYEALMNKMVLPASLDSYEQWLQHELTYKSTPAYQRDRAYWQAVTQDTEPMFTHINGSEVLDQFRKKKKNTALRYVQTLPLFTRGKNEMLLFPGDVLEQAIHYSQEHQFFLKALFLLAYRTYLSKVNRRESDVTINVLVSRRSTRHKKNMGGSMVQVFPYRTVLAEDLTWQQALGMVHSQLLSMYRHVNMDTVEVIKMPQAYFRTGGSGGYISSVFTFQPIPLKTEDGTPVQSRWYGNGTSPSALYLTIMDGDNRGGFKCYYEYQTHSIKPETIRQFHEFLIRAIRAGTANDQLTLGELLSL